MNNSRLSFETAAKITANAKFICGCDEAGRGCLAGPVVAAAVFIPEENYIYLANVDDSKKLTANQRAKLFEDILEYAAVAIAIIDAAEIDEINIYEASRKAMMIAVSNLEQKIAIDYILTDAMPLPQAHLPYQAIIKGDQKSLSIAAASIIAKCVRDNVMIEYSKRYPEYKFELHKGYGTKKHLAALDKYGIIDELHRKSYKPIKEILIKQQELF